MKNNIPQISFGVITALVIGMLVALGIFNQQPKADLARIKVVASIFPVADIAKNIAGDKIQVETYLPSTVSPHTFEPTIADSNKLTGAKTLFVIGAGLDDWATKNAADVYSGLKVTDLSKSVTLKHDEIGHDHEEGEDEEEADHEENEEEGSEEEPLDPHYWLSIDNAKKIANEVATEFINLDTENSNYYLGNLSAYEAKLDELKSRSTSALSELKSREIATFHNAFSYLAADFDLEVVTVIEEFPGKTPSAAYLKEVGEEIEEHKLKVLFKEPQLSDEIVKALAADYGVKVETLDDMGGVAGRASYIELIDYNVQTLQSALK